MPMRTRSKQAPGRRVLASLIASAAVLGGVDGLPGGVSAGTLEETIRTAIATNPEVGVVRSDRLAVDQELRQARAGYLPSLDVRGAAGPEYTNSVDTRRRSSRPPDGDAHTTLTRTEAELKLSQMLWDGNEVRSEVERQKARVNSASYRVEEAAEFVALNAIEAHLNAMRNQEIVRLNEANVEAHRRIRDQVEELERGGGGDIADVQQTLARISQAEASLATGIGELADSQATYLQVVGAAPQSLSMEPPPLTEIPASADLAAEAASVRSPTVQIAASDVDVSAAELRGTRANFYPRLDAELASTAGNDLDGQKGSAVDASALLVLRYNLYRGGADIAREREAFHRVNESRAGLERARRRAEEEARFSFNALTTARARTLALRDKAEAQRRTRDAYAQQFEIGQRDLLDVLDAENELFLARVSLVTAEYTERFAVYRLLAVAGDLLDAMNVGGPREAVNIDRAPADVQTPEAIVDKSQPLFDPRSEPRALRGLDAGEPPPGALDLSTVPPGPASSPAPAPSPPRPVTDLAPAAGPTLAEADAAPGDSALGFLSGLFGWRAAAPAAFAAEDEAGLANAAAAAASGDAGAMTADEFFATVKRAFGAP
jgi:adhesin transport system outer membrane protein